MIKELFNKSTRIFSSIPEHDGCLMLNVEEIPERLDLIQEIDKSDLFIGDGNYGVELEPHITIVYGIKSDSNLTPEFVEGSPSPELLRVDGVSLFENEEYDVLKMDVVDVGGYLSKIRNSVLSSFDVELTYPEYNPHITIGYFQKGKADKYVKELSTTINPTSYCYSVGRSIAWVNRVQ